jgi:Helix-turn-helix domain
MSDNNTLGDYLRARRELVQPGSVGLPAGGVRRVAGLRREEVAMLAGISSDYYLRLELRCSRGLSNNGTATGVSGLKAAGYRHRGGPPRARS